MSDDVPEHRQFVEMMHDVYADAQRLRQLKEVRLLVEPTCIVVEAFNHLDRMFGIFSTYWNNS